MLGRYPPDATGTRHPPGEVRRHETKVLPRPPSLSLATRDGMDDLSTRLNDFYNSPGEYGATDQPS